MPLYVVLTHLLQQGDRETAYHGTTIAAGKIIVDTQRFEIPAEPRATQTLGPGVYFWEGSAEIAMQWVLRAITDEPACVLKAELNLKRILDLREANGVEAFNLLSEVLMYAREIDSVTQAQVLAFAADKGLIDSVKTSTYSDPQRPWKRGRVMVCVYNTALINTPCVVWTEK